MPTRQQSLFLRASPSITVLVPVQPSWNSKLSFSRTLADFAIFHSSTVLRIYNYMSTGDEVLSKLKWVSLVCLLFMTGELIGGWIANSIAIMSDAMHLMSDLMAFAVSAYSVWLAKQPPPKYLSHGYQKAETLGALINIAVIWVVTLLLLVEATERVVNKEVVKEPGYMLITSVLGLLCNLVMVKILHGDENFKHEGCNHGNSHNDSNEEVHQHNGKPNGRPTKLAVSNGSQEDLGDTPL
jgi:cation diffusion facilitator family transporter